MGVILSRVNNALVKDLDGRQYVTLLLARLDPRNRAAELVRGILETVRAFTGSEPPSDDITSVICKVSLAALEASV